MVVVVSSDNDYSIHVKAFVEDLGYTVILAHGPIDTISIVHHLVGPAIFLVDYELPDMFGTHLANYIKKIKRFPILCYLVYDTECHEALAEGLRQPGTFGVFVRTPSRSQAPYNLGVLSAAYLEHAEYFLGDLLAQRVDLLTETYDRAEGENHWNVEWSRAKRLNRPISGVFIDVNNLKVVNDAYGHSFGDQILKELAKAMRCTIRTNDFIIRLGGDEFLIVLPETTRTEAVDVLERVRKLIDAVSIKAPGWVFGISFSAGVASLRFRELGDEPAAAFKFLMGKADKLMYRDKKKRKLCGT